MRITAHIMAVLFALAATAHAGSKQPTRNIQTAGMSVCGGITGDTCADDEWCDYPDGAFCGASDIQGICRPKPDFCTREYRPVCGCDGKTYGNNCTASTHGVDVLHEGECKSE